MTAAAFPCLPRPSIAEQAFRGLPRAARSLPRTSHQVTQHYALFVESSPNKPLKLELHQRQDGQWFWEYSECRFGQAQYAGVFDGFALSPAAARTYVSLEAAHAGLLAEVLATFPQRPGTLRLNVAG